MSKRFVVILFLLLALGLNTKLSAQCALYPVQFNNKVVNSKYIVEGKVVEQQSTIASTINRIYTINTVEVYSVYKGNMPSIIHIVTAGGVWQNRKETASSLLSLHKGQTGMFFLNDYTSQTIPVTFPLFDVYASTQGFYAYNTASGEVSDVFNKFTANSFFDTLQSNYGLSKIKSYKNIHFSNHNENSRQATIAGFSPLSVEAGVGAKLTINGYGFGNNQNSSKVLFSNSNDGGNTEIEAFATQYTFWSDTKIEVVVPAMAGTGKIAVVINGQRAVSNKLLQVNYAIVNIGNTYQTNPANMVGRDSNKGYIWHLNDNFFTDSIAYNDFLVSFKKWRCTTFINWTIGNKTQINKTQRDSVNVISYDEDNTLPVGVLGLCYSYYSGCSETSWYVEEQDLLFRKSNKWHFGEEPIAYNKLDFQSVVLHELGHAHQLGHTIDTQDLMHYSIPNGVTKRAINSYNKEGAQWILDQSMKNTLCSQSRMALFDVDLCDDEYFGFFNNIIYPNPFTDDINIDIFLSQESVLEVELFDITGKLIVSVSAYRVFKGSNMIYIDTKELNLQAGIYILKLQTGNEKSVKKLIKM
ncbi:MAG: T9SS type A sorting domain-containing protein [Bacteroidia bacterium]|nr:T9SS type A sorting domain-containing protein [Bacteroidia bacterium]MCZ2248946.1 T9SS type A sorting domain-containing protein [Bacteroidia bacterium]